MLSRITLFILAAAGYLTFFFLIPAKIHLQPETPYYIPVKAANVRVEPISEGLRLFKENCARCHNTRLEYELTGPALFGLSDRVPSEDWMYDWIRNSQELVASGEAYAVAIYEKWNRIAMDPNEHLSDEEIGEIIRFIDSYQPMSQPDYMP